MYQLVNIPKKSDPNQIAFEIDGQMIRFFRPQVVQGFSDQVLKVRVEDFFVGDHMLADPQALREMIGRTIVYCIETARDTGYGQARHDIRIALGIHQDKWD